MCDEGVYGDAWSGHGFGPHYVLGGCMQTAWDRRTPRIGAAMTARDKKLLAHPPYAKVTVPRALSPAHRRLSPQGSARHGGCRYRCALPLLRAGWRQGDPLRRDRRRGSAGFLRRRQASAARNEWPTWTPTADIKKPRLDVPNFVGAGPHNPMGARALYLFQGNRDTLFRIHGTNQPEYIGQAISSGCIRMTNEDVIDLYNRVPQNWARWWWCLAPSEGDSPFNPRMAAMNTRRLGLALIGGRTSVRNGAGFRRRFCLWPQPRRPSVLTQSSVRSSARDSRSNTSSISCGEMTSGGHSDSVSPASARTISPSAFGKGRNAWPDAFLGSKDRFVALSAHQFHRADEAEGRAHCRPAGCSPSAVSRAWNCGASSQRPARRCSRAHRCRGPSAPPRPRPDGRNR